MLQKIISNVVGSGTGPQLWGCWWFSVQIKDTSVGWMWSRNAVLDGICTLNPQQAVCGASTEGSWVEVDLCWTFLWKIEWDIIKGYHHAWFDPLSIKKKQVRYFFLGIILLTQRTWHYLWVIMWSVFICCLSFWVLSVTLHIIKIITKKLLVQRM